MTMSGNKNKITKAAVLAAAVTLAGCDRTEPPAIRLTPAPAIQVAAVENLDEAGQPTIVERRHFAIYSTYRVLSGDARDAAHEGQMGLDGDIAACSSGAMPLPD